MHLILHCKVWFDYIKFIFYFITKIPGITASVTNNKSSVRGPSLDNDTPPSSVTTHRVMENVPAHITSSYSVMQRIQTSPSTWYASHWGINSRAQQGNPRLTQATNVQLTTLIGDPKATSTEPTTKTNDMWSSLPLQILTVSEPTEPVSMTAIDTSIESGIRTFSVLETTSASLSKYQIPLTGATTTLHYTNGSMESVFSTPVVTANHTSNIQTLVKSVTCVLSSFRSYQNGTISMDMTMGKEMLQKLPSTRKIALSTKRTSAQISRFDRVYTISETLPTYSVAEKQRHNVSSSNYTTARSSQQSISEAQVIFSPIIPKATGAFSASHVVNNVEISKPSAFVSASSLNVQVKTFSRRSIPFALTTSHFAGVHAHATQTLSFTEVSNAIVTSVVVFFATTGTSSSSIQEITSSQSKAAFTEAINPRTGVIEPQRATITSAFLPTAQSRAPTLHLNSYSAGLNATSISSGPRTSVYDDRPIGWSSSAMFQNNTTTLLVVQRMTTQVVSSSKIPKTTAFSSGRSASRTSISMPLYIINKETSVAKNATVITRVIGSSRVFKAQTSKLQFSSIKDPENVSSRVRVSESPSEAVLWTAGTMTPSSLQASNTNVSTVGSTFSIRLFTEVAPGHQSETSSLDVQPSLAGTTGDYINLLSTEQKPTQVASSLSKDAISMLDNISTVQNSLAENSLNSITTPSTKTTGHYRHEQTSTVFLSSPKSVGYRSAATHWLSKVGGHSSENYRKHSVVSQQKSSPVVSTPVIFNSPFPTDGGGSPLLATESVYSFRMTMRYSSQAKLERTPSLPERAWTEHVPFTSATPKATLSSMVVKGITSTRSSPLDSSLKYSPIMESTTSRLPSTVSTHQSAVLKRRTLISTLSEGPSATYSDSSLLPPSLHISSNSGASTSPLTDGSRITDASVKKGILVSSSAFNELSPFTTVTSSTKTTVKLPRHSMSTSASIAVVSLISQTITGSTMATSVSLKNSFMIKTTAHAGLVSSLGTKQPTFSSSSELRVTTIQTQTPTRSPFRSSTSLKAIPSSMTFSSASSALVTVRTRPVPETPKQFEGRMVLQIPWNPQYQIKYTPEFQELASRITKELTEVLKALENFLSVQVLRLWKSSVGVDFVVFMRQNAQINGGALEQTLIGANRTGVLDLPITNLYVKELTVTTTSPSAPTPDKHKSLERWEIILIVSGILVFLLLLITCILAVSNNHIYLYCLIVDRIHLKRFAGTKF